MDFFHAAAVFPNGIGSGFICLIPKTNAAASPSDYCPITLIGIINKIVSKVLAIRLKPIIGSVISDTQSGFIANRSITDGPLMVNEIISYLKKVKKSAMLLKIDFEKAFDKISWAFLDQVMGQMNFPTQWRKWIMCIISSVRSAVLVNGSPTFEFKHERGVR